jgi:hypothetical protein
MTESDTTDLTDNEIVQQLEESLDKETLEKQLNCRDSSSPNAQGCQVLISPTNSMN